MKSFLLKEVAVDMSVHVEQFPILHSWAVIVPSVSTDDAENPMDIHWLMFTVEDDGLLIVATGS